MRRNILFILIAAVLVAMLLPMLAPSPTEAATQTYGYTTYVVQHGDTLSKIARRYCTTWQQIYALNRNVIGPDPDHLVAGMVLTVPVGCSGGGGGCGNVYDRGWMPHAQGNVIPPNYYWVIRGDTWYSIGKRFGVSVDALRSANSSYYPFAYTTVIIPCLNAVAPTPVPPMPTPIPPPTPTPPVVASYITITSPPANAVLPATFTVSGQGGNLFEGNVVVRARLTDGTVLAEKATVLQGPDVGTGGEGTWSVSLSVNAPANSAGAIEAYSPGTNAFASINVFFGGSTSQDYPSGQCQIQVRSGAPAYKQPAGDVLGIFPSAASLQAERREQVNNVDWYRSTVSIDGNPTQIWVPATSLDSVGAGC